MAFDDFANCGACHSRKNFLLYVAAQHRFASALLTQEFQITHIDFLSSTAHRWPEQCAIALTRVG
jgi:hypothetical protein